MAKKAIEVTSAKATKGYTLKLIVLERALIEMFLTPPGATTVHNHFSLGWQELGTQPVEIPWATEGYKVLIQWHCETTLIDGVTITL